MTEGCKGVEGCKKVTQAIGSWWFLASSFSFAFSLWPHDSQSLIEPDSDRMLGKATGEDWKEGKDWAGCWRSKRERGWEGFNGTESVSLLSLQATVIPFFGKQPACSRGHLFHIQISQKPAFPAASSLPCDNICITFDLVLCLSYYY